MNENQTNNQKKLPRERSAAYPAISLEDAVGYSAKLQQAFSKYPFSRENGVKEIGHQTVTGASGMKIASLVHYGLLDREGNAYRNSNLALRIAHKIDEDDFKEALKISAVLPKLYKKLLSDFQGRAVPTALSSILVRNHKIGQKVADEAGRVFIKTIEYAGLYENGIVSSELPVDMEMDKEQVVSHEETKAHARTGQVSIKNVTRTNPTYQAAVSDMRTVELPSGIIVSYPKNLGFVFGQIAKFEELVQKEIKINYESNTTTSESSSTDQME